MWFSKLDRHFASSRHLVSDRIGPGAAEGTIVGRASDPVNGISACQTNRPLIELVAAAHRAGAPQAAFAPRRGRPLERGDDVEQLLL
jgi:hypothetical protein